ncbi:group II intron maturase-specific domain-containing protein [Streptomyces sp. NPDC002676]
MREYRFERPCSRTLAPCTLAPTWADEVSGKGRVLQDKVRAATARSRTERPVSAVVADLNPVLRGWAAYFRNGNSGRKFDVVDHYVHERLAIFASAKHRLA